jgi:hypothetical protein
MTISALLHAKEARACSAAEAAVSKRAREISFGEIPSQRGPGRQEPGVNAQYANLRITT